MSVNGRPHQTLSLCPGTFCDVTLGLPCEFHFVHDVDADAEVKIRTRLLVNELVQSLDDEDFVWLELWCVIVARVVVVDWLVNCCALLQGRTLANILLEIRPFHG